MATLDQLRSYEQALAARNQELDAKIGSHLAQPLQPEPLAEAVASALQHLLKTAEVDEAGWEEEHIEAALPDARLGEAGLQEALDEAGDGAGEALPPQAALRLYKARVRALHSDVATLHSQTKEKDKRLDAVEKELRQLQAEKAGWQKQQKALESQVDKLRHAAEGARAKLQEKENIIRDLGREKQAAAQERRQADAEMKARDARLSHALAELERYKKLLEQAKSQHEGASAEVSKEDYNKVVAENKRLEQQKQELVLAFKKAMKLVDVLKRQKLHLEAAALLDISGRELMQAMDLGK